MSGHGYFRNRMRAVWGDSCQSRTLRNSLSRSPHRKRRGPPSRSGQLGLGLDIHIVEDNVRIAVTFRASESMNVVSAKFQTSAPDVASCPVSALREFAFIGRSNVGKSSLLNMLAGAKALAK